MPVFSLLVAGSTAGVGALILAATDPVSDARSYGWLGTILLALVSAFALWRAGSVKAWKETAEGRLQRIDDLVLQVSAQREEMAAMRAELTLPERIEGIIHYMGEIAVKQDASASVRLDEALKSVAESFEGMMSAHEEHAEMRTQKILDCIREGRLA